MIIVELNSPGFYSLWDHELFDKLENSKYNLTLKTVQLNRGLRQNDLTQDEEETWDTAVYRGAHVINRFLPTNAVIGSTDSGVLSYFCDATVMNIDGLVNDYGIFQ